jgi:hypothetical protein
MKGEKPRTGKKKNPAGGMDVCLFWVFSGRGRCIGLGSMSDSFDCYKETSVSIWDVEFIEKLKYSQVLNKDCTQWKYLLSDE